MGGYKYPNMRITILGNSSGGPYHGRHYTAQVVEADQHLFLVDCGEGTQMQLFHRKVRIDKCNQIFISHLHGDHVLGLMGLIANWGLKKRTRPLRLISPPGLRELVETAIRVCSMHLGYPLEFQEVDATVSAQVFENKSVEVWSIPLHHRVPACGWLFREKPRPLNLRPEALAEYGLEGRYAQIRAVKSGADLVLPDGRTVPNQLLTFPPAPLRAYAFCSDTAPSPVVAETVRGVDLLYHEATFTSEHTEEAALSFHSTARQAAEIASAAGAGQLILGHISGRYPDATQHLAEARAVFEATEFGEEGSVWEVGGATVKGP